MPGGRGGASTLIKRIVAPEDLTTAEKTAIETELGSQNEDFKLRIHAVGGLAQEIAAGRLLTSSMNGILTIAEKVDATIVITAIAMGTKDLNEIERILHLGEMGYYTHVQIETWLGL